MLQGDTGNIKMTKVSWINHNSQFPCMWLVQFHWVSRQVSHVKSNIFICCHLQIFSFQGKILPFTLYWGSQNTQIFLDVRGAILKELRFEQMLTWDTFGNFSRPMEKMLEKKNQRIHFYWIKWSTKSNGDREWHPGILNSSHWHWLTNEGPGSHPRGRH